MSGLLKRLLRREPSVVAPIRIAYSPAAITRKTNRAAPLVSILTAGE